MTRVRRLTAVCTVLSATALLTCSHVWGDGGRKSHQEPIANGSKTVSPAEPNLDDDLAASKFATRKVLTYRTREGDILEALQVQPKLDKAPPQPCDYLLLVDTSASQVGLPLANACILTDELIKAAGDNDRIAIWTANIPNATVDLTRGFQSPKSEKVKEAFNDLKWKVPLGDTDLANAVEKAAKSFQVEPGRRRVIVFMGDGMSIHSPVSAARRARLCEEMVKNEIAFFSVPLGPRLEPQNLHGFASGTGGLAIRILKTDKPADTLKRLQDAVALPILYPTSYQLTGAEAADTFPTRLPPLRTDIATLVVARTKPGQSVTCKIDGKVAGKDVHVEITEPMPTPEMDNFFLVGMFEQWKKAKDQPALMQADRALAYAHDISELARTELLVQAEEALARDRFDVAEKLYGQAKELDPSDPEAEGGLKVVQSLRSGKLTKEQLRKQFAKKEREVLRIEKTRDKSGRPSFEARRERVENLVALAEQAPKPEETPPPPTVTPQELLRRQRLAQQVEDQRVTATVNQAINEARRALRTDPEGAAERLKQLRAAIVDNFEISEGVRRTLLENLESTIRYVETEGARIAKEQATRLNLVANAEARLQHQRNLMAAEDQLQQRMLRFVEMMRVARYEDGFDITREMRRDLTDRGLEVPPAVTAAVSHSLTAQHLREARRLRSLREERYLATMYQVELSHVPFPDEPPIVFPPAAQWRKLTELRKERYESSGLSEEDPLTLKKIRDLKNLLNKPVTVEFDAGPLKDALGYLQDRYNIPIIVDEDAFREIQVPDVKGAQVKLDKVVNISLGTVLRLLLANPGIQGTYVIRRDYVEITTTQRQAQEKALRVYPVADLVIPIPNAINQIGVNQTLQNSILGGQFSPFGGAVGVLGGALGLAGIGGLGALGIGALGVGGLGLGGLGVAGLGLAGAGLGGAGLAGAAGLGGGNILGAGGPQNLGVGGGGFLGFAGFGGQLGQLGNLGGQFGLQGGDQSQILITLIRQVVGTPADWSPLGTFQRPQVGAGAAVGNVVDDEPAGDPQTAGALGYYPPARALVVKGTSRVHTRAGGGVLAPRPGAPPGNAALDKVQKDFVVNNGKTDKNPVVAAKDKKPAADSQVVTDADAKKLWQDALLQGVTEPGLIIAVTDFLAARGKFDHVAEFLKSELRAGIIARPWVYEALAIALQESKGSVVEIEQAQLSAIDLEPQDAQSFLRAAKSMTDAKRWDRALAFCKQAAALDPNSPDPYVDALGYAEKVVDVGAMEWAAGGLLSRDWPVDNDTLQKKAGDSLKALAVTLRTQKPGEAGKMKALLEKQGQRDLVIQLTWQGDADLDLEVKEPIGTVCNFMQRQTSGGGTLMGDSLTHLHEETYTAAQAFPGEYRITVNRIWGKPIGSKATVKIIEHQGTPQQKVRQETIVFDRSHSLKIQLKEGRRTSLAQVTPGAAVRTKSAVAAAPKRGGDTLSRLRLLADPTLEVNTGMKGGTASTGVSLENKVELNALQRNLVRKEPALQFQVPSAVPNGLDFTGQVTLLPDGQQRVTFNPVFQTVSKIQAQQVLNNPIIPGGQ